MKPTHSDISRDFGTRSTSVKCDLTAASSPLSQPMDMATAADHHLHTTSGPASAESRVGGTGWHPVPPPQGQREPAGQAHLTGMQLLCWGSTEPAGSKQTPHI